MALADPTRRQLLERLAIGPTTAKGLSIPLTRQADPKWTGRMVGDTRPRDRIRFSVGGARMTPVKHDR